MKDGFKIIDLFAGPGGLGEGFSAYKDSCGQHPFKIALSIEKEESAHRTLQLRSFYRQFPEGEVPDVYYRYLAGEFGKLPDELYKDSTVRKEARLAAEEARQFTLGEHNRAINTAIEAALGKNKGPWVLIGGPPCQAYSLVGRSRNMGIEGYDAEKDHRSFLYREYLKVIAKFRPTIFVMENVKGMLSAKVGGRSIFEDIRRDLQCPAKALRSSDWPQEYVIYSLAIESEQSTSDLFDKSLDPHDFVLKAENYGVPQARHRVILLGIKSDVASLVNPGILEEKPAPNIRDVIDDLPALRSGLSKSQDSWENWLSSINTGLDKVVESVKVGGNEEVAELMLKVASKMKKKKLDRGSNWAQPQQVPITRGLPRNLRNWYLDPQGRREIYNHDTRGHMSSDLHRYLFSACFSIIDPNGSGLAPKAAQFPRILAPNHANWKSGHFIDRFRVQLANKVATTVTSHISKDGHYFIHYDPAQCRSLTVREAARIQTFPDNYFFVGNRTQQYVQVGNAVPPYLANQIAEVVADIASVL
ncbi:MAG: DNA (cytosine-5-)-methyltransferase [Pseudomonadota bacterium]|nr:DNA (cytosine-5-)-methyltransferase [Pseudomonadota bacterium]